MTKHGVAGILPVFVVLGLAGEVGATSLTATKDLSGGAVLTASPDSITPVGIVYSWADKNGDGTTNDPVNAGLNLGAYDLTRSSDALGFVLNLFNGTANGAITWSGGAGGNIKTARSADTSPITITNASDITVKSLDASSSDWINSGAISVWQSGSFLATQVLTKCGTFYTSGNVRFTGGGPSAGTFQVTSNILSYGNSAGSVAISDYSGVRVGPGGIDARCLSSQGTAVPVSITNIGLGGVEVAGPILTYPVYEHGQNPVTINTSGGVKLGNVDTHASDGGGWVNRNAGSIMITAGGNVEVTGSLDTRMVGPIGRNMNAGNVGIASTGGWVKLNSITTSNCENNVANYAGDVTVVSHGDITISGTINLFTASGGARRGDLTLTTDAGGSVFLDSLNMASVNLSKIDSGTGVNQITNKLENFSIANNGGNGTTGNPYTTTQSQLCVPFGERLYYAYVPGVLNDYLGGYAYKVANLAGTPGAGGLLMVYVPPKGTMVLLR